MKVDLNHIANELVVALLGGLFGFLAVLLWDFMTKEGLPDASLVSQMTPIICINRGGGTCVYDGEIRIGPKPQEPGIVSYRLDSEVIRLSGFLRHYDVHKCFSPSTGAEGKWEGQILINSKIVWRSGEMKGISRKKFEVAESDLVAGEPATLTLRAIDTNNDMNCDDPGWQAVIAYRDNSVNLLPDDLITQ